MQVYKIKQLTFRIKLGKAPIIFQVNYNIRIFQKSPTGHNLIIKLIFLLKSIFHIQIIL